MEEAIQLIKPRWSAIFLGAFNGAVRGAAVTAVLLMMALMVGSAMLQEAINAPMYARGVSNPFLGFAMIWVICAIPLLLYLTAVGGGIIWLAYFKPWISYKKQLIVFSGLPFLVFGLLPMLELLMLEAQKGLFQTLISAQTVIQPLFGVAVALGCGMGFSNLWDKCYPEAIAFK